MEVLQKIHCSVSRNHCTSTVSTKKRMFSRLLESFFFPPWVLLPRPHCAVLFMEFGTTVLDLNGNIASKQI